MNQRIPSDHETPSAGGLHLSFGRVLTQPLPALGGLDRLLLRAVAMAGCLRVSRISGLEQVAPERDPFVLALNHNTRLEALLVPALLMLLRGGRRIHFLADWNFRMIPGMGLLYRRSGAISVPRKSARPRALNILKPLFTGPQPPFETARTRILEGGSVGIFPEGTVNPNRSRLLRGRPGAARLSLATGAPVVPVGLIPPDALPGEPIPEGSSFEIVIGAPIAPPAPCSEGEARQALAWHARIMREIASLSGKSTKPLMEGPVHVEAEDNASTSRRDGGSQTEGALRAACNLPG